MRGKDTKLGEGEGSKLGEPCPKVSLSQDWLPIEPIACISLSLSLSLSLFLSLSLSQAYFAQMSFAQMSLHNKVMIHEGIT